MRGKIRERDPGLIGNGQCADVLQHDAMLFACATPALYFSRGVCRRNGQALYYQACMTIGEQHCRTSSMFWLRIFKNEVRDPT